MKVFTLYAMPLGPSPSPTRSPTRAPTASVRVTRIEKEGYAMAAMAKAIPTLTQLNNGNYLVLSYLIWQSVVYMSDNTLLMIKKLKYFY